EGATLVKVTERVIAEAATHGRVVLVGRGAQAVLGNRPDALHVYVVASKAFRMKLAVERLGADPAQVERVVDETDRQRDQYVKTYYGRHRHEVTNYDLVVNAERLGFEGAAGLIVTEAKRRGWKVPSAVGYRPPGYATVRCSRILHAGRRPTCPR